MKISNNIYAESEMAIRSPIEKSAKFSIVHSFRSSACGYLFLLYFFTFSVFVLRHLFIVYFLFSVPIHILCSDERYDFFALVHCVVFLEQVLYSKWNAQQK